MEISISTGLYYKKGYKDILEIIKRTGCKNIELFLNQAFRDVSFRELNEEILKRDLKVMSIHCPLGPLIYEGESERGWIERCIELAKMTGAKLIVAHNTIRFLKNGEKINVDKEHLDNVIQYRGSEVIITTENEPQRSWAKTLNDDPDRLIEFLNEYSVPLTFDVTHWGTLERELMEGYELFKGHIANIHLSDFGDGVEHKVLGTGKLPLKTLLKKLNEDKYDGLITLEFDFDNKERNNIESDDAAVEAIKESVEFVKQLF